MQSPPDFTIITPSRNMLPHLKACVASVRDQAGVNLEHLVMDAGSTDGTVAWLERQADLTWISEPDRGMYDALNKGLEKARGRYVAYLNCDEQYLEGALAAAKTYFEQTPESDAAFAHVLLVNPDGTPRAFRKACPLRAFHIRSDHLYNLSCGLFFRRDLIDRGLRFDDSYRCAGDADFILRSLKQGFRFGILPCYTSLFQLTGSNLGASPEAEAELKRLKTAYRADNPLSFIVSRSLRRLEKLFCGAYRYQGPSTYRAYEDEHRKTTHQIQSISYKWPKKPTSYD